MAATTRIRLRVFMALALLALVLLSAEATQNLKKTTCPLCDMDVRAEINAPVLGGQHIYACEMAGHIDQLQNEPSKNLGKPVAVDLATDAIYKDATELSCAVCGKPFAALKYAVPWISMGSQKILTCSEEHALEVFNNPTKYVGTSEMAGGFCNHGSALVPRGSVMFNGFQLAIGEQATCALLLFQPWILTSGVKYAFGFLGVVLMAMSVELIGLWREKTEKQLYAQHGIVITAADYFQMQTPGGNSSLFKPNERTTLNATGVTIIRRIPFWCRIVLAGFYVANLTIAYFLMLIIMMYESLFFIAVVLGLGLGFFFFKDTEAETMSGHVDPCCST